MARQAAATILRVRYCPKCRTEKPVEDFYPRTKSNRLTACRECHRAAVRANKLRKKQEAAT
jgi:hypothetical protein